ncbi:YndJ family transporter [Leptospira sp. 201903074]|uniref:YndJ family transporter n=1 Tax=Leptospira abararensis TaxID=2810036 RepID=UPI001964CF0D|nr:YndJ family transporter [Leptospira abararensis]MBM9546865.1 YndJ family transporter [Leptospira abararensis]
MGLLPFGFSFLSAIWFYSGQNQYYLLGYNETWSYYAALHGCFIGWLFLSGIIFLSEKNNQSKINPIISLSIVFLFLLIAYGIYGNPILKKIGVIGYSFLMPFSLWYLGKFIQNQNFISQLLRRSSIVFLSFTLLLALLNEFYQGFPKFFYGYPFMIILHGCVNAFIVIPCFLGSLLFEDVK